MYRFIKLLPVILLFSTISVRLSAQDGMVSSGGDGTGGGGSFSFSFGQFAYDNYLGASGSVEQGVQHAFEFNDLNTIVPETLLVFDKTVTPGDLLCYNAQLTLTVAGEGHSVLVQNLGVADFIAGQSIRFLPGFSAQLGSVVHGSITTTNTFCDGYVTESIVEAPAGEKDVEIAESLTMDEGLSPEMKVNLYPNPNHGSFKINLVNFESSASIRVYNVIGSVFYTSSLEQTSLNDIDLPWLRNGIYFIKLSSGNKEFVKKIIVN
jgi:hypothetical protein